MIKLITLRTKNFFCHSLIVCLTICFTAEFQNANAQGAVFTADVNWPCWRGENEIDLYGPNGEIAYVCPASFCGNGGSEGYTSTNEPFTITGPGTPFGWTCGTFLLRLWDFYGDGWNCGGTATIKVN